MKLTDESLMPWGKYKDLPMQEVPADYLMWLFDNDKAHGDVLEYIKDNYTVIESQIKRY